MATRKKLAKKKSARRSQAPRHKTVLTSASDGRMHVFDTFLLLILEVEARSRKERERHRDVDHAKQLHLYLKKVRPEPSWLIPFPSSSLFRYVWRKRDPLDSSATLGAGGRVNVGFSQIVSELPELLAFGGVYFACDKDTAIAEYNSAGLPPGVEDQLFQCEAPIEAEDVLIDFDQAVNWMQSQSEISAFTSLITDTPHFAAWKYQKHPKLSQILAFWLWREWQDVAAVKGIVFRSTKNPSGRNAFIFDPANFSVTALPNKSG